MKGEAVFYGPKIDIKVADASGRKWQCSTIQFDFNLPKRFNLTYIGPDVEKHQPVMIHRALLGTIERFFGLLIEHYKGNFPTWLAPVQVKVLPISEKYNQYAREVHRRLSAFGLRSELDESPSTISYKIREAEVQKTPYMAICGKRKPRLRPYLLENTEAENSDHSLSKSLPKQSLMKAYESKTPRQVNETTETNQHT
jgi:threonyl-tRNA synthetase